MDAAVAKPDARTRGLRRFRSRVKLEWRIRKLFRWRNWHRVERSWDAGKAGWGPSKLVVQNTEALRAAVRSGEHHTGLRTSGGWYSTHDSYSKVETKAGHLAERRRGTKEIRTEVAERDE
jgi:hypothetical protein